jgi:hypothetical protein
MAGSARAVLAPRPNSFKFNDKVLLLDIPAKLGEKNSPNKLKTGLDLRNEHILILEYHKGGNKMSSLLRSI